ncbi:MAG TPA: carbamoyltransferase HypF [Bacteroidetes bacterium]|nr:carbamoyltransferase HypF [Bacteroidota bacterium]
MKRVNSKADSIVTVENEHLQRMKVTVRGAVQGVGFRPFVYRLATELGLHGWVSNTPQGVFIEVEGEGALLRQFLLRLGNERPPRSFIQSLEHSFLDPVRYSGFSIRQSKQSGEKTALVLADIAACPECLSEVFDSSNRRYLYPFTNCTHCGPRFTIIESLPYDRPNTTMKMFDMCDECRREYDDPRDRRFHAQPNACPRCGPHLELWESDGEVTAKDIVALGVAVEVIRRGEVLAVKGLGGFHLMVDARNETAVQLLRERKHREEKPFALMYSSIDAVRMDCDVSEMEQRLLEAPEAPIVLLERRESGVQSSVAVSVAPSNPYLGVMLPYTPLHHMLMRELDFPVVATSGNLSDEPICTDEHEALSRLLGIADAFLIHDRPIVRHTDDSIVRVMAGREMVVRRARGYAPLPVRIKAISGSPVLAVGAHLKNSVALAIHDNVFISQHIGDLETGEAYEAFQKVTADLQRLYEARPEQVVSDMHPEYLSTKYAATIGVPVTMIQHHYAHVASCMAENELEGRVLGVSWDGTGYGPDGTIWGGEFLLTDSTLFSRVASFRPFRLPGGDKAVKEPRRTALGVLYEMLGDEMFSRSGLHPLDSFSSDELRVLRQMLLNGVHSPLTTSVGRLFDAVASIVGLRQRANFEGQAAMELEFALPKNHRCDAYSFEISQGKVSTNDSKNHQPGLVIDWSPIVLEVLEDVSRNEALPTISLKFHNTLCEIILDVARRIGEQRVVLTGGCFQNKYLTERAIRRLREEGFRPYWHQRVPPNDGGIALGQVNAYLRTKGETRSLNTSHGSESSIYSHQLNQEESIR